MTAYESFDNFTLALFTARFWAKKLGRSVEIWRHEDRWILGDRELWAFDQEPERVLSPKDIEAQEACADSMQEDEENARSLEVEYAEQRWGGRPRTGLEPPD